MNFQPATSFRRSAVASIFRRCLPAIFLGVVTASVSLLTCVSTDAATFNEIGDAGQTLGNYQVVPDGINSIYGRLGFVPDIDMYSLTFGTAANINVTIPNPSSPSESDWFDTDVTIFDKQGHPLYVFDGTAFSFHVVPGTYLFAMADWNVFAADANGTNIADDYAGVLNPNGVFDRFVVNSTPYRIGDYQINFSMATVPEPANAVLATMGSVTLLLFRRR
jgi:hypothetical protein